MDLGDIAAFFLRVTARVVTNVVIDSIRSDDEQYRYERMLRDREREFERSVRNRIEMDHLREYKRVVDDWVQQAYTENKQLIDIAASLRNGEQFIHANCNPDYYLFCTADEFCSQANQCRRLSTSGEVAVSPTFRN